MMVAFYKHHIAPWMDATADLSHEAYRLYHVVCQMIYLNEGAVRLNEHYLAGACRMSVRAFRVALVELIDAGCLCNDDGFLENSRAEKELEKVRENRVNAGRGGEKSGKVRQSKRNDNENKDTIEAPLQDDRSLIEKRREENSTSTVFPLPSVEEKPSREGVPETSKGGRRKSPARPVPLDWQPSAKNRADAVDRGIPAGLVDAEARKFKDRCERDDARYADIDAAWRTWCNNAVRFGVPQGGPSPPGRQWASV